MGRTAILTKLDCQARRIEVMEDAARTQRSDARTKEADALALKKYLEWLKKMEGQCKQTSP